MKPIHILTAILCLAPACAAAQEAGAAASAVIQSQAPQPGPRWSLGIGTAVSTKVYAGEDTRVIPFPLLSYQGERVYWRGIGGGVHLARSGAFTLDATLSARMSGIERDDFGQAELAERGLDRALLEDRDDAFDIGLAGTWRGRLGQFELGVKHDVTGASKGFEANARYGYPFQWGRTRIVPNIGVAHFSDKLANYYYGTLDAEVARGVVDYKPGSVTVPRVGIDVVHPFAGRWAFIGNVSYNHLPSKITDSPLVKKDADGAVSAFIGVSRGF